MDGRQVEKLTSCWFCSGKRVVGNCVFVDEKYLRKDGKCCFTLSDNVSYHGWMIKLSNFSFTSKITFTFKTLICVVYSNISGKDQNLGQWC